MLILYVFLHCTLSFAVQCIVIGPVCMFAMGGGHALVGVCVFVALWVCYQLTFSGLTPPFPFGRICFMVLVMRKGRENS